MFKSHSLIGARFVEAVSGRSLLDSSPLAPQAPHPASEPASARGGVNVESADRRSRCVCMRGAIRGSRICRWSKGVRTPLAPSSLRCLRSADKRLRRGLSQLISKATILIRASSCCPGASGNDAGVPASGPSSVPASVTPSGHDRSTQTRANPQVRGHDGPSIARSDS